MTTPSMRWPSLPDLRVEEPSRYTVFDYRTGQQLQLLRRADESEASFDLRVDLTRLYLFTAEELEKIGEGHGALVALSHAAHQLRGGSPWH
jgi:hypothetical protein